MKISHSTPIVILTGAGISAESGIPTFRGDGGIWEGCSIEDVASREGFVSNRSLVHDFYNRRHAQLSSVVPNAAHLALAKLEEKWPGEFLLITQNVDDLHERAGSRKLAHMHGELNKARCMLCGSIFDRQGHFVSHTSLCPFCGKPGALRPHVVWFGEMPLELDLISEMLTKCGLFVSIGTSGNVYPAADFVTLVSPFAYTLELNVEPTCITSGFFESRMGKATVTVPALVEELLS